MAFTTLKPGTFLYRGTKGDEDPYDKGVSKCFMAYFGRDIYTAAQYAGPIGSKEKLTTSKFIWKYKVVKPIILLNLRDKDRMVFSNMILNLLKRVFQDYAGELRLNEKKKGIDCLKEDDDDSEEDDDEDQKSKLHRASANLEELRKIDLSKKTLQRAFIDVQGLEYQDRLKWSGQYDTIVDFDAVQSEIINNLPKQKGGNDECSPTGSIWTNVWKDTNIVSCDVLKAAQAFGIDDTRKNSEYYRSSNIIYDHYFLMLLFGSQLGIDFRAKLKEMIIKSIPKINKNSNTDNDKELKINKILEMCDKFIGYSAHPWPIGAETNQFFHEEVCFQKLDGFIECVGKCKFNDGKLTEYEKQIGGKRKYKKVKSQKGGDETEETEKAEKTFVDYYNRIVSNEDIPNTDGYEIVIRSGNVPKNTKLIIF